jgi:hypothetical protein
MSGIDYGCAQFLLPTLGFESRAASLSLVYRIILLSQTSVNQYSTRPVALLNDLGAVIHMAGIIVLIGALLVFAPKQPIQLLAIVSGVFICAVMVMPRNGRTSVAIIGVMTEFFGRERSP